ncbi:MAG: hypothetical protein JEZ01_12150 [Labilibaculum sp.]|nr:hypothetical protein [Labilibaculum sp.]MBI9058506.1 hypothetical protein [Labilibaculum sp.]
MIYSENEIVKLWEKSAIALKGNFSMPRQKINGGSCAGSMFLFRIELMYNGVKVNIHTGIYEYPLQKNECKDCQISITAKKDIKEIVELSIWRRDFFDKVFSRSKNTGYREFDKIIGIKPSKNIERNLSSIFKNQKLRNELINEKYRSYNLQTINKIATLERKSSVKVSSVQMMEKEFDKFSLLLDGLIDGKVF